MNGREFGCRIVVWGLALLFLYMAFMMMASAFKRTGTRLVSEQKAKDAQFDLPLVYLAINTYEREHQETLPPMENEAALKTALYPAYLADEQYLINLRDKQPYARNLALSRLPRKKIKAKPDEIVLMAEATPNADTRKRWVLFLDGVVREMTEEEWAAAAERSRYPEKKTRGAAAPGATTGTKASPSPAVSARVPQTVE